MTQTDTIYFAGGCFWGTEHFMKQINGVIETQVGYANSIVPHPSYKEVCTGNTGAAETVKVVYDPAMVELGFLIDLYFMTIDPLSINRQGNDIGTQYRTGIFYESDKDRPIIERKIEELAIRYEQPIAVEVKRIKNFYPAEEYHQDYLDKNPHGYCHIDPRLFDLARKASSPVKQLWRKASNKDLQQRLTPLQYAVTQHSYTEPPFNNEYWDNHRKGIYIDITTGEPLFSSADKFDSGCGWPSFSRPLPLAEISEEDDYSHGMTRTEARSKNGNSHLGHVFNDGPQELGGLRYCINSAALKFIPLEDMTAAGYDDYKKYVI